MPYNDFGEWTDDDPNASGNTGVQTRPAEYTKDPSGGNWGLADNDWIDRYPGSVQDVIRQNFYSGRGGTTPPAPHDEPTVNPPPSGGGGGGGGGYTGLPQPGAFSAPSMLNLGGPAGLSYIPPTPTFTGANAPPTFNAPTADEALNDPGYQFRLSQGRSGLQNWAAAKGTLNDSSTADALIDYNQNAASQEYQSVWNRDYGAYGLQRQNWADTVLNPTLKGYDTQAQAGQHQNDMNYVNQWNQYLNDWNNFHFNVNWATQNA